jgi:hypothetical protein
MRERRTFEGEDYVWKTIQCDEVFIFFARGRRTSPCAGARGKARPTPAHPGCRPYRYSDSGCCPYRYSPSSTGGVTPPAASPCADINVGRSRTH